MRAIVLVVAVVGFAACAQALAAQRTFVRSDGVDTNPCSIASPCRSFAVAIAATDPDGEIVVLDSAGYGIVTVSKGVSIIAPPGIYAGISVPSGNDGIDVAASGKKVVLRGLAINGQGGNTGINITAAAEVHIEYCVVSNMGSDGIQVTSGGAVYVDHTIVRSNADNGITLGSGGADLFLDDTRIANNIVTGMFLTSGKTTLNRVAVENNGVDGVDMVPNASADPHLSVRDSLIAGNGTEGVYITASSGSTARAEFEHTSTVRNGADGLALLANFGAVSAHASNVNSSGNGNNGVFAVGAAATLTVTGSTMTRNGGYGMNQTSGSTLRSPGNNIVDGNVAGALNGSITPITPM
jgi:hypothetical protein